MQNKIGELRPSQLITTFGPGAIMELPEFSVIIAGIDKWEKKLCEKINEPRLIRKLGIQEILTPPASKFDSVTYEGTLPAYRFPRYLVCPACRKLGTPEKFYINEGTQVAYCQCNRENPVKAFPSRFVVACKKGHVDDFPWKRFVHGKKRNPSCKGNKLKLLDNGKTGAIADIEVLCEDCGEKRSLQDAFSERHKLGRCSGHKHWLGPSVREDCDQGLRPMLRGASNIYFPVVESALAIPPYTNPLHSIVAENMDRLTELETIEDLEAAIRLIYKELREYPLQEVWKAIQLQKNLPTGESQDLLFPEWEALMRGSLPNGDYDFETEEQQVPEEYQKYISKLVMVRRLTEVRVLDGFTRIDPLPDATSLLSGEQATGESGLKAELSQTRVNWRPGIMTRGEGIFVALNEDTLSEWEARVENAVKYMETAFERYCEDRGLEKEYRPAFPGARYILLHTLAHSLMRQLCLNSGYSSTALRERIYSRNKPRQKMAGILIYTATPDSEGSLGGLVELAKTDNFRGVLWHTLQDARFCSGDPLCAEHKPEAVGDLNGAACHACLLAAETSCERSNLFLDRSFLIGTVSEQNLAFFQEE
jgi:hypothetical protein